MKRARIKYSLFEVGDTIRHRRRRHVRRRIVSFEQGLPWTFRLDGQNKFMSGKAMLITRIEEWEPDYGETQEDDETTPRQDDSPARLD